MARDILMGKNITNGCEYYGDENLFFAYNKKEDWCIEISNVIQSTIPTLKRSCSISLYTDVTIHGYNLAFVLDHDGIDDFLILSKEEFLRFLNKSLQ